MGLDVKPCENEHSSQIDHSQQYCLKIELNENNIRLRARIVA